MVHPGSTPYIWFNFFEKKRYIPYPPRTVFCQFYPLRLLARVLPPSDSLFWQFYAPRTFFLTINPPRTVFLETPGQKKQEFSVHPLDRAILAHSLTNMFSLHMQFYRFMGSINLFRKVPLSTLKDHSLSESKLLMIMKLIFHHIKGLFS